MIKLLPATTGLSKSNGGAQSGFRQPPLSSKSLMRLRPLLSHAHRFRYPLDCGGNLEHLRFAGHKMSRLLILAAHEA